jgi:hypothetical protein
MICILKQAISMYNTFNNKFCKKGCEIMYNSVTTVLRRIICNDRLFYFFLNIYHLSIERQKV